MNNLLNNHKMNSSGYSDLQLKAIEVSKLLSGLTLTEIRYVLRSIEQNMERKAITNFDSNLFE